jgi:hypothetical protein
VGIISEKTTSGFKVVQAVSPVTSEVFLSEFLEGSRVTPVFLRYKNRTESLAEELAAAAKNYIGTPYDGAFGLGEGSLYCSELVYFVFKRVLGDQSPLHLFKMNFNPWMTQWRNVLGKEPPQGKPGISPGDIFRSDSFEKF